MSGDMDRLDARAAAARDRAQMAALRELLRSARRKSPALRARLKGVRIDDLRSPRDIARIPVLRKSELAELQKSSPPFGGVATIDARGFRRLLVSPGPIFEPEHHGRDWWGAARALRAAGARKGDIVINCFSYHLTPGGRIMESGAHALGCAVIPGGVGNTEAQIDAIAHYRPGVYCGTPDFLKILLDRAAELGKDVSSITRAFVSGAALPASLRAELEGRGVATRQAYATADLGVIAFETSDAAGRLEDGMVVNEGVIVEIARPGTGDAIGMGEVGEVVVTRLDAAYPLVRFATGDLSALAPPLGARTNARLRGWLGRADQSAKIRGMFVHPAQIADVARRHSGISRARLVITRERERDVMELRVECAAPDEGLAARVAETLNALTKLRGSVKILAPGALPNDGKVICDERPVG